MRLRMVVGVPLKCFDLTIVTIVYNVLLLYLVLLG
jgi:hypothetical protein